MTDGLGARRWRCANSLPELQAVAWGCRPEWCCAGGVAQHGVQGPPASTCDMCLTEGASPMGRGGNDVTLVNIMCLFGTVGIAASFVELSCSCRAMMALSASGRIAARGAFLSQPSRQCPLYACNMRYHPPWIVVDVPFLQHIPAIQSGTHFGPVVPFSYAQASAPGVFNHTI